MNSFQKGAIPIKNFILGLIVGMMVCFGLYFLRSSDTRLRVDIGRMLDLDFVYMKDGTLMKCWVLNEGSADILVETREGTFTLPRSACQRIEKDVFLKFVRKAI